MTVSIAGFHLSLDVVVLGLVTGMVYGILAAGLVLVYRSSRIINFAHGDIGAFGAALVGVATTKWGVPYWLAFLFALGACAAIGAASEVVVIRRLQGAPLVVTMIVTLGLGSVLLVLSQIVDAGVQSGISFPQPSWFPQFNVGALLMTPSYTAMLVLSPVVVLALAAFLRRGRLGVAMRASAANPDTSRLSGMLPGRLSAMAWAMAGAMAAFTAILLLPTRGFSGGEFLGPGLLLRALVCAVIARMVSLPIALVAGVGLGVVEQLLLANYPSGGQVDMLIFVVIVVVLLLQRAEHGRREDKGLWSTVQPFRPLPRSYRRIPAIRNLGWAVAAVAITLGVIVPELGSNADATTFTLVAAFAIVGLSVTVVAGLGGQLSLGQFAIAGVGATAAYVVTDHGAPFVIGLVAAAGAAAVVSLVIALPALRIRGLMLAVATLGFALAGEDWLFQQSWTLGTGVTTPRPAIGHFAFELDKRYYLVALAVLLVAMWLARNVWNGGVGRSLRAVRDNEDAARSFTIPATTIKLRAFMLGGVLAGLGGAIYGTLLASQSSSAYQVTFSINAAAVAVVGGLGTLAGPILGSLYIIGLPSFVTLNNTGLVFSSAGWLLLLLRYPGGIVQAFAPLRDRVADTLARRAGLDPLVERAEVPAGGVHATEGGIRLSPPPPRHIRPGDVLLRAEGLAKRFGGVAALGGVDLEVRAGEILGLIGPNGAGKTTLFEVLGGFTRPDAGSVHFEGRDVTRRPPERRAQLGLIRSFQDAALFPTMTVGEVVMVALERAHPTRFVASITGLAGPADRRKLERSDELLTTLGLLTYRDTQVMALSTGTRRITELACLIALEPILLLLDEPTSGIAQRETEALGQVLRTVKEQLDVTMVVIEHDIPLIMGLANRVVAMESGRVVTVGSPAEVQSDPRVIASYLGEDVRAIERSARTTEGAGRSANGHGTPTCALCPQPAGPDGVCADHRGALSGV